MGLLSTIGAASGRAFGLTRVGAAIRDAYFNLTTLLLPGNGTNGAQNNTFLDSSTNNFTITRNGNTTQGTFSPFSQTGWSNFFTASSNYFTVADNAALDLGTGDFTIEFWVFATVTPADFSAVLSKRDVGYNTGSWRIAYRTTTGKLTINCAQETTDYGAVLTINAWNHFAFIRSGTTLTVYANGVAGDSDATWAHNLDSAHSLLIAANTAGVDGWTGYISNLRIVKGTAVYTSNFTPSPLPLTAITNTSLLTCQSNRFVDNSTNNFTITPTGTPSVQAFSPFAPTAAYSAATVGGSGYFDGAGDYLQTPSSSNLAFGTGDFCVEFWFYRTANVTCGLYSNSTGSAGGDTQFEIQNSSSNKIVLIGWNTTFLTSATSTVLNAWTHIAVVRSGTSMALFFNGVRDATATSANNFSSTNAFVVGLQATGAGPFAGYISGLRSVKGSSVYNPAQTTITIPTAPPTAITNTQLLLNYTNAGITDATAKNDLETVGNAQISTTQSKFGGSSMYFDGTGDYLIPNVATSDLYAFGSGDFTIEMWVNFPVVGSSGVYTLYDSRPSGTQGAYASIALDRSTAKIYYYVSSATRITGSVTIAANTWYHVAISRSGTSTRLFVNGTQDGSTWTDSTTYLNPANRPVIAASGSSLGTEATNGYIDDLRITKGYARYTSNFTAPTAAFPLQ